jgi:L-fuconolactonase
MPYLDTVVEAFGPSRLLVGSDSPEFITTADFDGFVLFRVLLRSRTEAIFGTTATRIYSLM